ncbi:hypothetical protein EXIGLDRAFT_779847 [Exidia glandulosa HHB12029]|uniref:Uncharacterized protein n=1 Tax=Exidia glandulosa HHB12029 TaxID=1314781 RepID=A0A165BVN0_EXIGL|nr:hypothetical protein EXIGLDRAFT_779847 [Exidia glandulosa HHB12029]
MSNNTEYPPFIQFTVDHPSQTLGAWLAGGIGDLFLQGVIIVQTSNYYRRYRGDSWRLKCLVAVIAVLNVLKSIQTCAILWDKPASEVSGTFQRNVSSSIQLSDWVAVSLTKWYAAVETLTSEAIAVICQCYFVVRQVFRTLRLHRSSRLYRLYRIVGNMWMLVLCITPFLLAGIAGNIALTVLVFRAPSFYSQQAFNATATTALVGIMGSDAIVTGINGISKVELVKLVLFIDNRPRYILQDGQSYRTVTPVNLDTVTAAICAFLNLVFYLVLSPRGNGWFIAFNLWLPKLYTISMLFTILARQGIYADDPYVLTSRALNTVGSGVHVATTTSIHFSDARPAQRSRADGDRDRDRDAASSVYHDGNAKLREELSYQSQ